MSVPKKPLPPGRSPATPAAQAGQRLMPAPPAVYRPQPTPKVLQTKTAASHKPQQGQPPHKPQAPPVFRPQPVPKVLQAKQPDVTQRPGAQPPRAPSAPPAYRPQPVPKVLQLKESRPGSPATRPAAPSKNVAAVRQPASANTIQRTKGVAAVGPRVHANSPRPVIQRLSAGKATTNVIQPIFMFRGKKFKGDMFEHEVNGVKIRSYANRHTIYGLAKNKGGMKAMNTLLLVPVDMEQVSTDAYRAAWNQEKGGVSIKEGTTFMSEGVEWGINAATMSGEGFKSVHIWPIETFPTAREIGAEMDAVRAYIGAREKGKSREQAEQTTWMAFDNIKLKYPTVQETMVNACIDTLEENDELP